MTPEQIIEVVQAFKDGKKIEYQRGKDSDWQTCTAPCWDFHSFNYRVKPAEPREFWINIYGHQHHCLHASLDIANREAIIDRIECIHVREVIE